MRPSIQTFFALGRPGTPRWLVPAGHRLHGDPFLGWQPYRATSRLAWAAMKSAVRCGAAPPMLPADSAYIECIANLDWRSLGWYRPCDPEPLVYVGTPGNRRKVIVHLIDPNSHSCELIVKVPLTAAARPAIEHEAKTLLDLQNEGFEAAPRLVAFDRTAGVASQTIVRGSRAGLKLTRELALLLQSLELRGGTISLREVASALEKQTSRLELSTADRALAARALDEMNDTDDLPAVRVHGDFAPWNIKLPNGSAALVDWEDSWPRGLPLHDAYHFMHMTRCLFGKGPRPVSQELRFRYPFPLTNALRWKLELAYLLQTLACDMARPDQKYAAFALATLHKAIASRP